MERILRYLIIGGLFLLPFIPFVVANSMFFPFITGKSFAFRIIIEIVFGLWIILALKNSIYRPSFSWILVAITAFITIIALADIFGENIFKSFWSNFERMEGLVAFIHYFAFFLVAGTVLNTRKLWGLLAGTSIGASAIMGIYSIFQIAGFLTINQGGVRVDGTFGNAAYLAIYMLFHAFVTLLLLAKWRAPTFMRYVLGAIFLLQVTILFYTATRGTILGILGGLLLSALLVAFFGKGQQYLRKGAIAFLFTLVILISGFFALKNTSFVEENLTLSRLASISISEGDPRFSIWSMSVDGFREHPILGWGQENFNLVFNKYYRPSLYSGEPWFDRAHNIAFDWLIAGGILGLLAYLSIFVATLYYLWRSRSRVHFSVVESSLLTGLLAGYFFHNLFVFDNLMSYVLFFSLLAYIYNETRSGVKEGGSLARTLSSGVVNRIIAPLIIVGTLGVFYFLNVPGIQTSAKIIDGLSTSDITQRTELFREASSYNSLGSQEVAEQLVQTAMQAAASNVSIEQKQEIFLLAESEIKEELKRAPDDARLHVFLGSLYDQFAQHEKARKEIKRAIALSPNKQRIYYQLAFNYLNLGEYDEALPLFEKAFNLYSQSDQSRIYYASAAIYSGREKLAEELLDPLIKRLREKGIPVIDNNTIMEAYAQTGNFEKLLEIWQYRVLKNPEDVNSRLSLAATLVQLGRDSEAIEAIQAAIARDPGLMERGEVFIKEIREGRGKALIQR